MRFVFVIMVFAFLCVPAVADEIQPQAHFPEKSRHAYFTAGHVYEIHRDRASAIVHADIGVGYFFWDDIVLNLEANGWYFFQDGTNSIGYGAAFVPRWYFATWYSFALYGELGFGGIWTDERVPPGATHFNFTELGGIGAQVPMSDIASITLGVRYRHISNARSKSFNPGFDGIDTHLGLVFSF